MAAQKDARLSFVARVNQDVASGKLSAELNSAEFKEQQERADILSKALLKHLTNEKGEILARVEESRGFQEIYDYRGGQKYQHRLDRRREQASFDYSSRSHLFQKVYYANGLTANDELALRTAFN